MRLSPEGLSHARALATDAGSTFSYLHPSAVAVAALNEAKAVLPVPGASSHEQASPFKRGGTEVALGSPTGHSHLGFDETLAARRSGRTFHSLNLESLSYVLTSAARVQDWRDADDGFQITHRPAPSAGGRQSCELVVVANSVAGIDSGLWWFDGARCALVAQPINDNIRKTIDSINVATSLHEDAPAVIFVVAHFGRTLSRYPAGSTLVWRDAGVILGMLHLASTAKGLASCIVGTSGVLIDDADHLIADVGALVLGTASR